MAGVFGGSTNSSTPTVYNGIQIQTSLQGTPVTLMWGKARFAPNIFWYNNFQQHQASGTKGGGKGGGKGSGNYTYTAAVMLGLCEGPIYQGAPWYGIEAVWVDQTEYAPGVGLAKLGLTLFHGTAAQAVWSYLTSAYPAQAIPYESLAYLANSNYNLGSSAALPNHSFEVAGPLAYDYAHGSPPTGDANPAAIVEDFLTNPQYSIGLAVGSINSASLAFYSTYCYAQGIFLSPVLDTQEQITQILDRWASLTNTWIFWSGGSLKFVPLGDGAVTSGSITYTPNLTIQYNLTYDDFIATKPRQGSSSGGSQASKTGDGGPIQVTRIDPADAPNHVKIEIKDRGNQYNAAPVEWQDQGLVDQFGQIDASVTQAHEICDLGIAAIVCQLIGQRLAYIRNTYAFKLGWEFCLLEPGDLVTLTDPHIGLANFPARIQTIDEDEQGVLSIVAEEFPGGLGTVVPSQQLPADGGRYDPQVDPGPVNPPAIFEPSTTLTNGAAQVWVAASGGANWGGAAVSISFDGTTYTNIGLLTAPALQGVTTADLPDHADPDAVDTLALNLAASLGIMPTGASHADADAFRTLCLVTPAFTTTAPTNGELIAYGAVSATGTYTDNLTYLRRALYGTAHADHPLGSFFTRINLAAVDGIGNAVLTFNLPPHYIGANIYLKFQSFNSFGNTLEDISTVTAYLYSPSGQGYGGGGGGVPTTPSGFNAVALTHNVVCSWTANPPGDNVTDYIVVRKTGTWTGQPSGATTIWTGTATATNDLSPSPSTTYTYWVAALNAVGTSLYATPVTVTTGSGF